MSEIEMSIGVVCLSYFGGWKRGGQRHDGRDCHGALLPNSVASTQDALIARQEDVADCINKITMSFIVPSA
jgi:hypothetical protein